MRRPKIDWDTVELVEKLPSIELKAPPDDEQRWYIERRGRSLVKSILAGAAVKARAEGVPHTHVQLRQLLSTTTGLATLVYSWDLVTAAVESDHDLSRGVVVAAHAIREASKRLNAPLRTPR